LAGLRCLESGETITRAVFDVGILPKTESFGTLLRDAGFPPVSVEIVESENSELVQCADLYAGFYRTLIATSLAVRG
jgi:hypothetical protein